MYPCMKYPILGYDNYLKMEVLYNDRRVRRIQAL